MTREVLKAICKVCTDEHPRTLFAKNGVCVFCAQKQQMKAEEHAEQNIKISESERRKAEQLDARTQLRAEMERLKEAKAREELRQKAEAAQFDPAKAAEQELARRVLAKQHLLPFVQRTMPDYKAGWVHKDICEHLEWFSAAVAAGESPRLAIFMPPRHGKSQLASIDFPAWHLGKHPNHEFISCSYSGALAMKFSRKVRALVRERGYQQVFPEFELDPDSQSAEEWLTTKGGGYRAAGVGGPITGTGAHCVSSNSHITTRRGIIAANEVMVGDEVVGYDHERNELCWTPVLAIAASRKPELVTVGDLECTPDHRVWTETRGYIHADELEPEDGLVVLRGVPQGLHSNTQGAPTGGEAPRITDKSNEDFLLGGVCSRAETDPREEDMPGVRGAQGQPRENMHGLLREGVRSRKGFALLRKLRQTIRAGESGAREISQTTWGACKGFLWQRVLRPLSPGAPAGNPTNQRGVRNLRAGDNQGQAAEVLFQGVLLGEPEVEARTGIQGVPRRVAESASGNPASGYAVQALHEVRCNRGTSHRPQRDKSHTGESDRAVSGVSCLVSQQPGTCSRDLESGLQGAGYSVVDLQTGTENFFANQILVHNCLVIDDPVKNREEAESETTRESVWDWYTSTAYTRLAPGGGVLLILTRWHDDDLAGRLMTAMANDEGDEWRVVNYPAIAEYDELYRKAGEPLHPDRYPLDALKRIKRAVGQRDWSALYQQNPVPNEGAFFTKSLFKWYLHKDMPPWDEMIFYTAWDLAVGQKQANDFSVGVTVGVDKQDNIYVVDIQRGRWDSLTLVETMLDTYETWRPALIGIERGQIELSIGPLLLKRARERRLAGFGYEPLKPGKNDKVARAQSIKGRMQQGRVFFRAHCDVTQSLVNEMLRFPAGVHDDCVDAIAYIGKMLDMFAVPRTPKGKPKKSWKDKLPLSARSGKLGWQAA